MNRPEKLLNNLKSLTDEMIGKHKAVLKAVWVATPDEIISNDDVTIMILVDDLKLDTRAIKKLEAEIFAKEHEIRLQSRMKIHTGVYRITEYFEQLMQDDRTLFREIQSSIPIYDPTGFVLPLKKLIERGGIAGLARSQENLARSMLNRQKAIKAHKVRIAELLATSVVAAGQAALVAENQPVPYHKTVDEELLRHFKDRLSPHYPEMIDQVFSVMKKIEHGELKEITGQDIDHLFSHAKNVQEKMEELVRQARR